MEKSKDKSMLVIKSATIVIAVTLITKLLGFVREICMGSVFGTSLDADVYLWAMSVTTIIFMAIASAASSAMLPIVNEFRLGKLDDRLKTYLNKIITFTTLIGIIISAIYIVTAPFFVKIIAQKYEGDNLILATRLVQILSVTIIFIIAAYVVRTMLQAHEKFFMYSITSLPYNAVIILYLLFGTKKYGIMGLAIVTIIGWIMQLVIQFPTLRKIGVRYLPDFKFKDKDVLHFSMLVMPLLVSTLIYSINTLVDKSIALNLSDGKVSGLNYGYNMYSSIVTTIIIGITTVLYPKLIESNVKKSKEEFKDEIINILNIMTYIALPLMVALIVLNKEIVEVAYMRNSFTKESVELTRYSLIFYALGTFAYTFQEVILKVFYTLKEAKIPMITSIISVIINIILDIVLVRYMDYKGLALATTIAVTANMIMLVIMLERKIGRLRKRKICLTLLKSALSLVISVIAAKFVTSYLYRTNGSFFINIAVLMLAAFLAGILYLGSSYILKMNEAKYIYNNFIGNVINKFKKQKQK